MQVIRIVELDKKKKKIVLENEECFALYNGEVRKYQLEEGAVVDDLVYQEILDQVLIKRARERMLYLLKDSDKTERQIREKLETGYYPKTAIEAAVAFGKKYHYIDDIRYAENFIRGKGQQLSRKELEYKLQQRGIGKEMYQSLYEELEEDGTQEDAALERLIQKKNVNFSEITPEEKQKLYAYFIRKGFSYEAVRKKLDEFESRDT
ncbi:MAG: regulatory protein RecX [Lachnospiraceae bacterium]|nr:regulatory protein RecX [Lachnospiraceae bacterium]